MAFGFEERNYPKYLPYVFTEEGIYMLISVLNGEKAVNQRKILLK